MQLRSFLNLENGSERLCSLGILAGSMDCCFLLRQRQKACRVAGAPFMSKRWHAVCLQSAFRWLTAPSALPCGCAEIRAPQLSSNLLQKTSLQAVIMYKAGLQISEHMQFYRRSLLYLARSMLWSSLALSQCQAVGCVGQATSPVCSAVLAGPLAPMHFRARTSFPACGCGGEGS